MLALAGLWCAKGILDAGQRLGLLELVRRRGMPELQLEINECRATAVLVTTVSALPVFAAAVGASLGLRGHQPMVYLLSLTLALLVTVAFCALGAVVALALSRTLPRAGRWLWLALWVLPELLGFGTHCTVTPRKQLTHIVQSVAPSAHLR